ncbi:ABC transporter ATP-binding protein [Paenibacillus sp. URB8-2]|uniref:ABC transporter ATP-binding protein n=1 Tax=Paenibacillus sp. URB8-2 TaxID=2741301 RepID=UPI0015BFB8A5|nr:ABC transporter ATP-binding protein [Paenibacillus sp. URB8-2]BCG58790.1 ABC transporter ATP-binding protein [Paenibacillus sp. URB8-2]
MAFLKIENLTVNYGNIKALKGIDIEVEKNEIVTLIGSNGAGKTTTMNTIAGLKRSSGGRIMFDGEDITQMGTPQIVKKGLTLSPEGRQVFPKLSVFENIELGAYTRSKKERDEMLEVVYDLFPKLKERRSQSAGTLSGGEQQMLAVGRALMCKPKLLMLDEPSLGLAPLIVKEIFDLIVKINKLGTTILLVEQNARMALAISQRGYVLETGKIILKADADYLLNSEEVKNAYLGGV